MTTALTTTVAAPRSPVLARRAFVDQVMGMPVSVHVRAVDTSRSDVEAAAARVFAHLHRVDAVLSTWRADSVVLIASCCSSELHMLRSIAWRCSLVRLSLRSPFP